MEKLEEYEIIKVTYPIPFYTQQVDFDDKELQGFKDKEDAEYWQQRGCGIASVKMIIDGFQKYRHLNLSEAYGELLYKGLEMGAHCDRGWIHKGLVKIAECYGISGANYRFATIKMLQKEIEKNRPCIASVTVGFNGGKIDCEGNIISKGGHLIVVKGLVKRYGSLAGFIVNHPSSYSGLNLEDYIVNLEDFKNSFSGAFMSFTLKNK